jgi:hypothetical protein
LSALLPLGFFEMVTFWFWTMRRFITRERMKGLRIGCGKPSASLFSFSRLEHQNSIQLS